MDSVSARLAQWRAARQAYRRRYEHLREAVWAEGRRIEALPYDEILTLDETTIRCDLDGWSVYFTVEVIPASGGALHVWIDGHGLPRWRKQPGYNFLKVCDEPGCNRSNRPLS